MNYFYPAQRVFPIGRPAPAGTRREDVPLLVRPFLRLVRREDPFYPATKKSPRQYRNDYRTMLGPGNIRGLKNVLKRDIIFAHDKAALSCDSDASNGLVEIGEFPFTFIPPP